MPQFDEKHIKINECYIVWDGITRPDKNQDGSPKYSLKVVVHPSNPDVALFNTLAMTTLQQSEWAGNLPAGGRMPTGSAAATEFNGLFTGWAVLNCNSQRLPDVYSEDGQLLEPMQYGNMLYGGQRVDVLVHCYKYDKAGNKGIATGLDGFSIIASANAPRQQFGSAGVDTSSAFGGGAPAQAPAAPAYGAPAQAPAAPAYGAPAQAPAAPAYGAPAPAPTAPAYGAPQSPPFQGAPVGTMISPSDVPAQAHNFLPQG